MSEARATRADNRSLLVRLAVVALGMFGFGYALVPFYDKICQVTGLRDIDRPDVVANTQVDATRSVTIELDANTRGLPWRFRALVPSVVVHPGALTQVEYEIVNETARPVTGQAIPSYLPRDAAGYFRKLDCFCFTTQTLAPGERRRMPVVFVLDSGLPADVATVTLSYTFFEVEGGGAASAAAGDKGSASRGS
ncbi:MAG: cytochrome c oxidase assembly protein [Betaproteobacteria bacterium]